MTQRGTTSEIMAYRRRAAEFRTEAFRLLKRADELETHAFRLTQARHEEEVAFEAAKDRVDVSRAVGLLDDIDRWIDQRHLAHLGGAADDFEKAVTGAHFVGGHNRFQALGLNLEIFEDLQH